MKNWLVFLLLQVLCKIANGQFMVESGAYIRTTSDVRINLDNMDLVVNGNADQQPGSGAYVFSGNSDNVFKGTAIPTFDKILVAKIAGSRLALNQNLLVASSLKFVSGDLDLNNSLLQIKPGGLISGESPTGSIVSSGNGYVYTTTTLNAPTEINPGNLGVVISSAADLGITTIRRRRLPQVVSPGKPAIGRYYEIYPSNNIALNATLRLYYSESELNGLSENTLTLWRNAGSWEDQGYSTRDTAKNYVEKQGISSFSTWTLAPSSAPLPVTLASFRIGHVNQEEILLHWVTAMESSIGEFQVEKSSEPTRGFTTIAVIKGANIPLGAGYDYTDRAAMPGVRYYYRLKMIDFDQTYAFSRVVSAMIPASASLYIYPNPATAFATILSDKGINSLSIFNTAGNRVSNFGQAGNRTSTTIRLDNLPDGAYLMRVTDSWAEVQTLRFIIAH